MGLADTTGNPFSQDDGLSPSPRRGACWWWGEAGRTDSKGKGAHGILGFRGMDFGRGPNQALFEGKNPR